MESRYKGEKCRETQPKMLKFERPRTCYRRFSCRPNRPSCDSTSRYTPRVSWCSAVGSRPEFAQRTTKAI
jgi:hypothetical protein